MLIEKSAEKKIALITGAASGIGLAIAQKLSGQQYQVIITDINEAAGVRAARELNGIFYQQDVADEQHWLDVIEKISAEFGRLDVLVNNAGTYVSGNIEVATLAEWRRMQTINTDSVFLACKYAIPLMKKRGGAIINLSSGAALRPTSGAAAYCASKAAVMNLTRSTALYCAEQGYNIRCNSIHPGMVETAMVTGRVDSVEDKRKLLERAAALHPLGRIADVSDVAAAVAFLASDDAQYITGVAMPVDGGYAIA